MRRGTVINAWLTSKLTTVLALVLAHSLAAQEQRPPPLSPEQAMSVEDSNATISVRGVLTNAGTNYFTDMRIVITDPGRPDDQALIVQPWLPAEVLAPRSGGSGPPVISDFLDKEVILTGQIAVRPVKGQPPAKTLIVKGAELVKK